MDLRPYVEELRQELSAAAETGGEAARTLAERLSAALEPAVRLTLLDALSAAADEITRDLAPGSVEVRLRGREPAFVVIAPPAEPVDEPDAAPDGLVPPGAIDGDDGVTARINFRLGESLKGRIEEAAGAAGLSVNAWLVRAAAAALRPEPTARAPRAPARGGQRFTGWVR
jgi:hypothetical protein